MSKKSLIKLLKIIIPLGIGVFLIYYSLSSSTPEERATLWENIKLANPWYVLLSLVFGVLSHLSRAYRWKYLLEPMGYRTGLANRFMAVMAAYLANLGIPRSGEFLRGALMTTYEEVPFEKAFGTIISERLADFIMLLSLVALAIGLQTDLLLEYFAEQNINPLYTLIFLVAVIAMIFVGFKIIKRAKSGFLLKIKIFAAGLVEGMLSILQMKHKWAFIGHTLFIWLMYVAMFWVIKFTIPEIAIAPFSVILAAFIIGSFSISVTNGGIGVYPVAIGALFVFFGFSKQGGEAFGWIIWGSQTLLVVLFGALSFLLLPLLNRNR
ncbi:MULTISPECIES: lysylphosphatidylglycerol synthase transmembrane domain-containing protein [unclassified Leeuwenhoekiella]|uniref:lysylphosphatidylglycerol synthase transmembrane domain-containing protein n=1 Tax=unclassified Leeuwenhoekiella TaxID=2615029 RepID=UPI000C691A0D|nr:MULTISPECIES: lysylphosphatidylglycerol synthase transmembrane domain-containing protein [unclassified Leeuwenhoekiella]MAW95792.1 TIGR00374 family protein [Leeuwenhoekiella sp.]MBA82937.1 TIGR00374 family protein [Leeuwenhoekiella sp.]